MGALCCCPSPEDLEEYTYPHGCIYQHCCCLRCCMNRILNMYSAVFYRVDGHGGASSSASAGLLGITSPDSSPPDTFRPPPRPLPYDVDPRYVRLQRDGLVSRREKTSSYLHEDSEPIRRDNNEGCVEALTTLQKRNGADGEEQIQGYHTETSEKCQSSKTMLSVESVIALVEDEDICPTCLDEYTVENPKICAQCGHHFHLGCIYEWMERSENCPVCNKEMVFSESP